MRRITVLILVFVFLVVPAWAQGGESGMVFGGYSFLRPTEGGMNHHGFNGEIGYNLAGWVSIVGDFSGVYASSAAGLVDTSVYLIAGGAELHSTGNTRAFVHLLAGVASLRTGMFGRFSTTESAIGFGGGMDIGVSEHLAIRPVQADLWHLFVDDNGGNLVRISAGVLWRF